MSSIMSKDEFIEEFTSRLVNSGRSQQEMLEAMKEFQKIFLQKALEAEMNEHLGYKKHAREGKNGKNSRNGYSQKNLATDHGKIEIDIPRDRQSDFEPQIVKKGQRKLQGFEEKIIALYARGQTTRDIAASIKDMYDVEISHSFISSVTEAIIEDVERWQNRPLASVYPIVYLDCIVVKVHQDKRVLKKSIYLALGVTVEGYKELLGIWINENEGATFWLSVLTELQNRGAKDIFIFSVDGLTGFPEAIEAAYPRAKVQLCIVHMVRNSLKYVSWKERKQVASDLRAIYSSLNKEEAQKELEAFSQKWDARYGSISKLWYRHWENLITIFDYPDEIRKIIYTTNAIESLNSVIRKAIKNRRIFPSDTSAIKLVYLACENAAKKWTMPIRDWIPAMNRFTLEYGNRFEDV